MWPVTINSRELISYALDLASDAAKVEILTALKRPQEQVVTLLVNRSEQLAEQEREKTELEEIALYHSADWGSF